MLRMDDHNHIDAEQAQCCKAVFALVNASIGNAEGGAGKHPMSFLEIKAVLLEI